MFCPTKLDFNLFRQILKLVKEWPVKGDHYFELCTLTIGNAIVLLFDFIIICFNTAGDPVVTNVLDLNEPSKVPSFK